MRTNRKLELKYTKNQQTKMIKYISTHILRRKKNKQKKNKL